MKHATCCILSLRAPATVMLMGDRLTLGEATVLQCMLFMVNIAQLGNFCEEVDIKLDSL